ncbi:MAG: helix-turn-helix domain-containing protein [Magnetococcales bacterium]|nr:helix-turn-helix domain-containing protein [Magnetococcales bacterium]
MLEYFSARLKEERKRLGFIQDVMAKKGGVSKASYCAYEAGTTEPSVSFVMSIAAVGADVTYILTGVRSEERRPEVVAEEVAGVLYVIESILKKERVEIPPDQKARMVLEAYKKSTPEERQMMIKALEEGVFMLPLSIAKLFRFVS